VSGPIWVGTTNLAGDGQADLRVHGGADKAINLYPFEHYANWLHELEIQELPTGAFGENLTTTGAVEADVCIGDIFEIGGCDRSVGANLATPPTLLEVEPALEHQGSGSASRAHGTDRLVFPGPARGQH
jgi:hypothetical protein